MVEEKYKTNLEKIEKLIVEGQTEILKEVRNNSRKIDENSRKIDENSRKIDENSRKIDGNSRKIDGLNEKLDKIDKKHDINTIALYDLLKETREDIKNKLDEHIRLPAHA